mgnify:CR=1 FL=1
MTYVFNMHEAKTKLSRLVDLMESGEEVIIARDGEQVAKLVAVTKSQRPMLGEFPPITPDIPKGFDLHKSLPEWEQGMARKDALLIELMRELADEQSAA